MSTRLNSEARNTIWNLLWDDTIHKEILAMEAAEDALCDRVYMQHTTNAERAAISQLNKDWFAANWTTRFNVAARGQYHELSFSTSRACRWGYHGRLYIKDEALADQVLAHAGAKADMKSRHRSAEASAKAMLKAVTTFERLNDVWPEGRSYFEGVWKKMAQGKPPAIRVEDINKAFGLPKEKAA